jgi:hypothetical protein
VLYVGLALAWAALTLGGAGVSYNALFDVLIGGTAASMLAVEQLAERVGRRRLGPPLVRALALLPLCIPVLLRASPEIRDTPTRIALLPLRVARVEADREFLAAQVGPALCEQPALCYWAGKDYEVDAFHTVEKLASGALPLCSRSSGSPCSTSRSPRARSTDARSAPTRWSASAPASSS